MNWEHCTEICVNRNITKSVTYFVSKHFVLSLLLYRRPLEAFKTFFEALHIDIEQLRIQLSLYYGTRDWECMSYIEIHGGKENYGK